MVRSLQSHCSTSCQVSSIHRSTGLDAHTTTLRFSNTYPTAKFYKLDVDEVPDVAQELGIRAMPTFLLFKKGEKIGEVVGANPKALEAAIKKGLDAGEEEPKNEAAEEDKKE